MDLSDEQRKIIEQQEARNAKRKQRKPKVKVKDPVEDIWASAKRLLRIVDNTPVLISIYEVYAQFGVGFLSCGRAWGDREYALDRYKIIYDTYQEYQNIKNCQVIISKLLEFGHEFTEEELTEKTPEFSNVEMP
jgi:hypothetical protein